MSNSSEPQATDLASGFGKSNCPSEAERPQCISTRSDVRLLDAALLTCRRFHQSHTTSAPVSLQASHRLETHDDVPPIRTYVIRGLRQVFEEAGVEFIRSPWDGPGVRLWKQIEPAP